MGNICTCDEKRSVEAAPLTLGKAKKKQPTIERDDSSSKLMVPAQPPTLEPVPEEKAEVEAVLK